MENGTISDWELQDESIINIPDENNSAHSVAGVSSIENRHAQSSLELDAENDSSNLSMFPESEIENADGPPTSELEIENADGPPASEDSESGSGINICAHLYLRPPYGREEKRDYLGKGRPLYEAARNGKWDDANHIFEADPDAVRAYITEGFETPLHISALANQLDFVTKLVQRLNKDDLAIKNKRGNTALCLAAANGNVHIAHVLIGKYLQVGQIRCPEEVETYLEPALIRGNNGSLPVMMAAKLGNEAMVEKLHQRSSSSPLWTEREGAELMKELIAADLYESAGKMNLELAVSDKDVLMLLATKPMAEISKKGIWETYFCWGMKGADSPQVQALKLLDDILKFAFTENDLNIADIVKIAPLLLFIAAERGNFHLFKRLIYYYPELVWKTSTRGLSMFHVAVKYRHESIFDLLHDMDEVRKLVTLYEDNETGDNMLHLAATLAPKDKLNTVTGAAFQMQQAICWYKAVEKIVPPAYRDKKNEIKSTPADIFDKEHERLLEAGEKWVKATAKSCMLVAALTATVMFSSAFTVPGGNDDKGHPYLLNRTYFKFLIVSEVIGMLSSSTSILMFLSILTSRVNKYAFQRSLPCKLMMGVGTLFVSIVSMVIAFCTTIYLSYGHPGLLLLFVCVPILFITLKFRLWADLIHSTFVSRFLFQSSNLSNH